VPLRISSGVAGTERDLKAAEQIRDKFTEFGPPCRTDASQAPFLPPSSLPLHRHALGAASVAAAATAVFAPPSIYATLSASESAIILHPLALRHSRT
jgi:hypothetical protein